METVCTTGIVTYTLLLPAYSSLVLLEQFPLTYRRWLIRDSNVLAQAGVRKAWFSTSDRLFQLAALLFISTRLAWWVFFCYPSLEPSGVVAFTLNRVAFSLFYIAFTIIVYGWMQVILDSKSLSRWTVLFLSSNFTVFAFNLAVIALCIHEGR